MPRSTIVITGTSAGLGFQVAQTLVAADHKVFKRTTGRSSSSCRCRKARQR